jgi:uncharacterized protein (DUF1697 family)
MRYVALLRGINLGARNRVAMADLRALLEGLGATEVRTLVASGNAVFASRATAARLQNSIEAALKRDLGVPARVLVRTGAELARTVKGNPFLKRGAQPGHLYVTFLEASPSKARVAELMEFDLEDDAIAVVGRDVYLHAPNGYGRSKLSNVNLERRLGVAGTTRNWNSVTRLAEMAGRPG